MSEFHFLRPEWCWAILPLLVLIGFLYRQRYGQGHWRDLCDAELLPYLLDNPLQKTAYGRLIGAGLAGLLAILALAGPTWQRLPSPGFRNDTALVIALNLSPSMDAGDVKPSRMSQARYKIADLLKQRKDGQTALLVYGGAAFTVTPLTTDTATISSQLEAINTDIMPSPGSDVGVAIDKALQLLRHAGQAQGHILLVTDNAAGKTDSALADYRLSVLAVGTSEGAPIQQPGGGFVKDSNGNILLPKLDASALSKLAANGRGIYQPVTSSDQDVLNLSRLFNAAPSLDDALAENGLLLQQWDDRGPWLLLCLLPWAAWQFRKGLLMLGLVVLLSPEPSYALDWDGLWQNPNQRGAKAFQSQQYQQAAEQFNDPNWRAAALIGRGNINRLPRR